MKTEEEIKQLAKDELKTNYGAHNLNSLFNIGKSMIEMFEKGFAAASQSQWISVKEPPQNGQYVYVYALGVRQMAALYEDGAFLCYDIRTQEFEEIEKPLFWQPQPEPPIHLEEDKLIAKLEEIYDRVDEIMEDQSYNKLLEYMKEFDNDNTDINSLKTILVATKSFRENEIIKSVRKSILERYNKNSK